MKLNHPIFHVPQRFLALFLLFSAAQNCLNTRLAQAYPELVRHGYLNCIACHVSPSGAGVLTPYGRELSREVLSTWGKEGESAFAYGLVKSPEWLTLGGDFRTINTYSDTTRATVSNFYIMQADLEAAVTNKKWIADATLGYQYPDPSQPANHFIFSRRHYLNYRLTDELSLRAGKFLTNYGINTPDHIIFIKRDLGWDENFETYNLEAAWLGEQWNVYATAVLGRPDATFLQRDTGLAVQVSAGLAERYKVGLSYFKGSNDVRNRNVVGPFGILGFTPHLFLLTEWDFQRAVFTQRPDQAQWGLVSYNRLDYEMIQGLHGYVTQELSRTDFSQDLTLAKSYGIGLQWFPRPHFELNFNWQLFKPRGALDYSDYAWFMFHYYP